MKVDFNKMSDEEILEYVENLSDEEFAELDEETLTFLDKYLEENVDSESEDEIDEVEENEDESVDEEVELDESDAANTLKPGAGSGTGDSKVVTLGNFMSLLSQLGKEDLTNFYNQSIAQIGHEADKTPGSAEANRNTVNAKPSAAKGSGGADAPMPMPKLGIKEDIDEMFSGDELSEELKEKASVVFEAAVETRSILERARLEEEFAEIVEELEAEYEQKLDEAVGTLVEDLEGQLASYVEYTVKNWIAENEIAIDSAIRADIAEDFITGLKNLFAEHYITVPEEKLDIVNDLQEQVEDLQGKLNSLIDVNIELQEAVNESTKKEVFEASLEGLTETQIEKFRSLIEGVEFEDGETYNKKLHIIKENYFTKAPKKTETGLITEEIDGSDGEEDTKTVNPAMKAYVDVLSKSSK